MSLWKRMLLNFVLGKVVFILVTTSSQIFVDFDNADALLVSEVKMLLEHRKAQHESQDDDQDLSEVTPIIW